MQFNVAQLMKEHTGTTRHFPLDEDIRNFSSEDMTIEAPLTGEVTLMRDTEGILVTGQLHTEASVPCVRCLEPVQVPVDVDLEEQFYPTVDVETGRRLTTPEDADPDTLISNKHILDISELVRQSLVLALPMHPVHAEGCEPPDTASEDGEVTDVTDPRWSALQALRDGEIKAE